MSTVEHVPVDEPITLADYEAYTYLREPVRTLRNVAEKSRRDVNDRTVWMVNSTREGGGVAEVLPKMIALLRELGVATEWLVVQPEEDEFFPLTKHIHNLIHGKGSPDLLRNGQQLYSEVSQKLAKELAGYVSPDDILAVHDPQPAAAGAMLVDEIGCRSLWRCHIGTDRSNAATEAAWEFLKPWLSRYDRTVFTLEEYIPPYLEDRSAIIQPGIDPLNHKNRELSVHKLAGILTNASLVSTAQPTITPPFETPALRLQWDGSFAPATQPEGIGLLFRPIVTQISRWDRLKGFGPLMEGFVRLKERDVRRRAEHHERHRMRLELVRLVLAGPDPDAVADDPEGREVFEDLCEQWLGLDAKYQRDIALLRLPMQSRKINALMVNVLQRCSTIAVQNSLQEGFGLTVAEAMWKGVPVLGSKAAGVREQIEDKRTGCLVENPEDPEEIAEQLDTMLQHEKRSETWATNAHNRVVDRYLVMNQVQRWIEVLAVLD